MSTSELMDMVNERDEVVGSTSRELLKKHGCLWRAAHVWFVTPHEEVIFQVRSMKKKTEPGMWDATVSGHVRAGEDYLKTAIRETKEETGIGVTEEDLIFLGKIEPFKIKGSHIDTAFRGIYMHIFDGAISDLKIEEDEGNGFMKMMIEDVLKIDQQSEVGLKIVPGILTKPSLDILRQALIELNIRNPIHWIF